MRISDVARSVAANAKSTNILADKVGRVVTRPTLVKLYSSSSAVGILMRIPGTHRSPLPLEDFVTQFALTGPQDEIHIFLRNRTAGALTATTVLDLDPVA